MCAHTCTRIHAFKCLQIQMLKPCTEMMRTAFILIITIDIIQVDRKRMLLKEDIWIEFYPIHGQKPNPNKLKRFSESYWRQRILLNIQINNWNPILKQSSLSWSKVRPWERVPGQCSFLLCLVAGFPLETRVKHSMESPANRLPAPTLIKGKYPSSSKWPGWQNQPQSELINLVWHTEQFS